MHDDVVAVASDFEEPDERVPRLDINDPAAVADFRCKPMITYAEALRRLMEKAVPVEGMETVPLLYSTHRVLAEDIVSPIAVPRMGQLPDGRLRGQSGRAG